MGDACPRVQRVRGPRLGLGATRSPTLPHPTLSSGHWKPHRSPARGHTPMPLSRRGRRPRLAASPVASSSLPRAAAHPLRRVGRGTPLLSHELRLTRRRHSSEKIPTGPEPHADFRPGKGLQERAAGDATDAGEPLRAGMDSQYRLGHF
ncbi:uncharacterized protein LOC132538075 isoform X2 [Erinaceus europaeus]|uniref:Uncharacterized protein LOC132538075 isoform X2 n=1 Tax=Erinaceus europaeus TaxID=9365 RepID=A0ABM3X9Y7_ERIEU|nr:uncharacterized protein LOC132538075 isoform X2 [Erinaceus europaeus]